MVLEPMTGVPSMSDQKPIMICILSYDITIYFSKKKVQGSRCWLYDS